MILFLLAMGCTEERPSAEEQVYQPKILESLPHDPAAFTQGLLLDGDRWLESTGLYGKSQLRELKRDSGELLRSVDLPEHFFGEGLAWHGEYLFQLTWRERTCIVYDRKSFQEVKRFTYPGEGWGLCTDGTHLFLSDGSSRIRVLDPENFKELRSFVVRGERGQVKMLNELEWVGNEIWANIFQTGWIVRFDREGQVLGYVDLRHLPLKADRYEEMDVLNGIAWDEQNQSVWVTGKLWKKLYRISWPPEAELPPAENVGE